MRIKNVSPVHLMIPVMVLLLFAGCGGGDDGDAAETAGTDSATEVSGQEEVSDGAAAGAAEEVPDACVLFDKMELEQTLGWELRDGDPQEVPPGTYACEFEMPPLIDVTRNYPDPALPESIGFSSLNVNTYPTTVQEFEEFRELLGEEGEDVPGIGDGAYFYGYDMIYGRVGGKGFSMRIYTAAQTDEDRARVREMMLTLARKATAKL